MYARYFPPKKEEPKHQLEIEKPPPQRDSTYIPGQYARYFPPPKTALQQNRKILFEDVDETPISQKNQKIVFEDDDKAPAPGATQPKKAQSDLDEASDSLDKTKSTKKRKSKELELDEENALGKRKKKKKTKTPVEQNSPRMPVLEASRISPIPRDEANELSDQPQPPKGDEGEMIKGKGTKKEEKRKIKKAKKQASKVPDAEDDRNASAGDDNASRHKALLKKKDKSLQQAQSSLLSTEKPDDADGTDQLQLPHEEPNSEVHGLEPLPQPEPVTVDSTKLPYDALPDWLAHPVRVSHAARAPFSELGLNSKLGIPAEVEKALQAEGWKEANAVQTTVMPLLMPALPRQGDLVVSASTGSGKTLAYVLPMIRDISRTRWLWKLRGVVVVPTRELVRQVRDVCEACAGAFSKADGHRRVKVGIALGSKSLKEEQRALMDLDQVYDPSGWRKYQEKMARWPETEDPTEAIDMDALDPDYTEPWPFHTIKHISKVDILICTPGRLVEHLWGTKGFNLDYVRWFVVDEADKLLGQNYNAWLENATEALGKEGEGEFGARDFADSKEQGVRKIILSATIGKDLGMLHRLKLRKPKYILLEGKKGDDDGDIGDSAAYELPDLLEESAIKVREEGHKPLHLVELLQHRLLGSQERAGQNRKQAQSSITSLSPEGEKSNSADGEDSADEDAYTTGNEDTGGEDLYTVGHDVPVDPFTTTALIFTKTNENANRLTRLLALLAPDLEALMGTLTSNTRTSERRKTIRSFQQGKTRILVASDLAARGMDLPALAHVINYDMPPSVEVYVHRVGRTARAGRPGHAWTLFTKKEAGWFFPEVAGQGKGRGSGCPIKRTRQVRTVVAGGQDSKSGLFNQSRVAQLEAALATLGEEVTGKPAK